MEPLSFDTIGPIQATLRQAGEYAIRQPAPVSYQLKPDRTPFSQVEIEMEKQIIDAIRDLFPNHQVISEESGSVGTPGPCQWFLDPIDGTKMFLVGGPTWGISLGLIADGRPSLGFFYMPRCGDFFWGGPAYGAYFNDTPLNPTLQPELDDPLVFFGVPANFHRRYRVDLPRVRALGSTAVHLAYVASGASIGALTRRIHLWDIAGLLPILETAGVVVEFLSGQPFFPADYLDGSRLPEELLVARPGQMELIRSLVKIANR